MSVTTKIRFLDVFDEDGGETLTLKKKVKVNGEVIDVGEKFKKGEKIAGVDFHLFRYFDLTGEMEADIFTITGVLPLK